MSSQFGQENETPYFVGVDVGGTNIKLGIVDNQGKIVAQAVFPTNQQRGPQFAIEQTKIHLTKMLRENGVPVEQVVAVGLGTPGTMDVRTGMILEPPNLPGWRHFPIRDRLSEGLGLPVTFANDANAAAFGEYWVGGGRDFASLFLITLGTGVGGGIVVDNHLIEGTQSLGGEIGHVTVDWSEGARTCSCGARGHLEAYASATALVSRARSMLADFPTSRLQQVTNEGLSAREIAAAAEDNDDLGMKLVVEVADYLARGIAVIAHLIDPHAVMLGGAMNFGGARSNLGQQFLERIKMQVASLTFPSIAQSMVIDFALLGANAGFVGAAGLARIKHWQAHDPAFLSASMHV